MTGLLPTRAAPRPPSEPVQVLVQEVGGKLLRSRKSELDVVPKLLPSGSHLAWCQMCIWGLFLLVS